MMLRLLLLAAVFILTQTVAAEVKDLTREQKLAELVFADIVSVSFAELVRVEIPDSREETIAPKMPWKLIGNPAAKLALQWMAAPVSYSFNGTAACFDPGMRIMILEKQRKLTLDVCLHCSKMSVVIDKNPPFAIDFSEVGLACYKAIYFDFMEQQKVRH